MTRKKSPASDTAPGTGKSKGADVPQKGAAAAGMPDGAADGFAHDDELEAEELDSEGFEDGEEEPGDDGDDFGDSELDGDDFGENELEDLAALDAAEPPPVFIPEEDRCAGFVALIGATNAGKSTLLNALVGAKVSIISHKVQTTRALIRGVAMHGPSQVVFVDTPGIFAPKRRLDRAMVTTAWGGASDADMVALLIDARKGIDEQVEAIMGRLKDVHHRKVLILNKIDLVRRETLLALAQACNDILPFDATFMVSALNHSGVGDVLDYFAEKMPKGPWLYPEDQISDLPMRMLAAEITREKIFHRLHDELPYSSTVETTHWKEMKGNAARIEQTIFVERESQKKIVLGKNGDTIRNISMSARKEITEILERPVHLFLFVKVRENWADDPERYREMGLDFPRGG